MSEHVCEVMAVVLRLRYDWVIFSIFTPFFPFLIPFRLFPLLLSSLSPHLSSPKHLTKEMVGKCFFLIIFYFIGLLVLIDGILLL